MIPLKIGHNYGIAVSELEAAAAMAENRDAIAAKMQRELTKANRRLADACGFDPVVVYRDEPMQWGQPWPAAGLGWLVLGAFK